MNIDATYMKNQWETKENLMTTTEIQQKTTKNYESQWKSDPQLETRAIDAHLFCLRTALQMIETSKFFFF